MVYYPHKKHIIIALPYEYKMIGILLSLFSVALAETRLGYTYVWHLQQPIYWPAKSTWYNNTYQFAYESMTLKSLQGGHPQNDLQSIFGLDDRVAVYQYRAADSIHSASNARNLGAHVTYPGDLIENVNSIADHNTLGYSQGWNKKYTSTSQETTTAGYSKLDLIGFPYHHSLGPLVHTRAYDMELAIQKVMQKKTWGQANSKGFFPAEMAFSETMIPSLVKAGYEWVVVSNSHISRAVSNYTYSQYGDNNTPPNKADQINPPQSNWYSMKSSRGCSTNNAVPFAYTPHYAKHVDPATGTEYKILVVPAEQGMSWQDGYQCYGTSDMDNIQVHADPKHPILVVLAHDGDNAFGGGYSYYMECVQNLANQAMGKGYEPTQVDQYLHDHPVDSNDLVHVEDGAWINAEGDFGDPTFVNWNWPLFSKSDYHGFNVTDGWSDKQRHYAITTAAENWVETAEDVSGGARHEQVQQPTGDATHAELAWHYYLAGLASGYLYYGAGTLDMCLKDTIASNNAVFHAKQVLQNFSDKTAPTIWRPYRLPYNPGSYQYGQLTNYKWIMQSKDFYVYTFVYDVSGVSSSKLYIRKDKDGVNPLSDNDNEVYESNSRSVEDWEVYSMTGRIFPKGNYYDWTGNCFDKLEIEPEYIADLYYAKVTGLSDVLVDYYVEAIDNDGNVAKSDIFHVYVGSGDSFVQDKLKLYE